MTYDPLLRKIARYVDTTRFFSKEAMHIARLCLLDSLGCALLSLQFQDCKKLLGPLIKGTIVPNGARIPGLDLILDPAAAAFNLGCMIRWLDYNDTFLAKEWAHPSDNIGALFPLMDHLKTPFLVKDLLIAIIKAYEIQGGLALENSFNKIGIDHVILVKAATGALTTHLLGGNENQITDTLSQCFIDSGPLRTYRHAPNAGSRKSWAAGDAASRGVFLSYLTMRGEQGYNTPLSAPKFGLEAVLFNNIPLQLSHTLGSYIIENILFKISFPAEFHAQTAVEAAFYLRNKIKNIDDIASIEILTHEPAIRIIDKQGDLNNPADRDHCMQYMVAAALIYGTLTAGHYSEKTAQDPRINTLRSKIHLKEHPAFTSDYYHPEKRSIASSVAIMLKNGEKIGPHAIEFPLGHKKRREESLPFLFKKFQENALTIFSKEKTDTILQLFQDEKKLENMPVSELMSYFSISH